MKRPLLAALLTLACGSPPAPKAEALPPPAPSASTSAKAQPPDPEPWRDQRPPAGPHSAFSFPVPARAELKNGLSVLVVHKAVPVASLLLVLRHGASACPLGKSGLAALTARMLTEGTRQHPGVKLAEAIEQLGTTLDEDAGRDSSSLSLSTLTADVGRGIQLLGEVATEPAFSPKDFERVQAEWLDGLRAERQAPERLASLATLRTLLGQPYGSPVSGSLPDVQKLRVQDLIDFHRKAYGARNAALIVVGDVDLASVQHSAEEAFVHAGGGQSEMERPFTAPATPPAKRILLVDRPGAVQSALALAQLMPKRSAPGYERRQLLATLFGGLFTSRLNMNLREQHAYTYGAHAQNVATNHWGALYLGTSVRTDVTADALRETLKELELLKNPALGKPIDQKELARAQTDLVHSLGARLEYGARIADSFADLWVEGEPLDYYQRYPALLGAQTPSAITSDAGAIDIEHLVVVVVGDRAAVQAPLEALGYHVVAAPPELTE